MYLETWRGPLRDRPIKDVTTIGYPIVSVISIISCLAIICITIKHEQFRKPSAVSTIAWCVVTIIATAFVLPVTTNNVARGEWNIGQIGCQIWLCVLYLCKTSRGLLMSAMVVAPYTERFSDRPLLNRAGYLINTVVCLVAIAAGLSLGLFYAVTAVTTTTEDALTICVSNSSLVTRDVSIASSVTGSLLPSVFCITFLAVVSCQHRSVPRYPGSAMLVIVVVCFTILCVPGEILFIMYKSDFYIITVEDDVFNGLTLTYFSELAMSPLLCLTLPWSSYKTIRTELAPHEHHVIEEKTDRSQPRGHLRHVAMYGKRAFTQHTADLFLGRSYTKSGRAATFF